MAALYNNMHFAIAESIKAPLLILGCPNTALCRSLFSIDTYYCDSCSHENSQFLLLVNTQSMVVIYPPEKLQKLSTYLSSWYTNQKNTHYKR